MKEMKTALRKRAEEFLNKNPSAIKKMPPGEVPPSASDCYRFVLSNPAVDLCLCGPRDLNQMQEALQTLDLGPLDPEEMTRLKKIGDYVRARKFFS